MDNLVHVVITEMTLLFTYNIPLCLPFPKFVAINLLVFFIHFS